MASRNTVVKVQPDQTKSLLDISRLKDHVRDHRTVSEPILTLYALAAEAALDGKDGFLGVSLRTQTLEHTYSSSTGSRIDCVVVPYGPIQSLSVVRDGVTLAEGTDYKIRNDLGITYLDVLSSADGDLVVEAVSGYGDDARDIPMIIRAGAYILAAELFKHRASTISGPAQLIQIVPTFEQIIGLHSRVGQSHEGWAR